MGFLGALSGHPNHLTPFYNLHWFLLPNGITVYEYAILYRIVLYMCYIGGEKTDVSGWVQSIYGFYYSVCLDYVHSRLVFYING